jgi:hypothetical protein
MKKIIILLSIFLITSLTSFAKADSPQAGGRAVNSGNNGIALLPNEPSQSSSTQEIKIDAQYKSCKQDSDCTVFEAKCQPCCDGVAVNSNFIEALQKKKVQECSKLSPSSCDCMDDKKQLKCLNSQCSYK